MRVAAVKFVSFDVVFQEIPDEITLAVNISGCPNRCFGCHSSHLLEDCGEELTPNSLDKIITPYYESISCVCFMGGDSNPAYIEQLAAHVQNKWSLKTAWYSGRTHFPTNPTLFHYLKLGPYIQHLGGLKSTTTNQRFYTLVDGTYNDTTSLFWR